MKYLNNHNKWGDDVLASDLAPTHSEDDGTPTLPGIVLRERLKRSAIIAAVIVVVVLACVQGRSVLLVFAQAPATVSVAHMAATPIPTHGATAPTIPVQATQGTAPVGTGVTATDTVSTNTPTASSGAPPTATAAPHPTATAIPPPMSTATPIPPTPLRVNLLVNPGFEGNGGWATSTHSFNEQGGHNSATRHTHWDSSAAYSASTSQTVDHLTSGTYQAAAWVETSCGASGYAFSIVDSTNNSQLAGYTIPTCQANWVQITIQATVSHGTATIKFTTNLGAADWLRMDDITFMRLA